MITRPSLIHRWLVPGALWRVPADKPTVFLTFDDGPVPSQTPWVLDVLAHYGVPATFFMVGDNVRRYPGLLDRVLGSGHAVGNHTMHHLQGLRVPTADYLADVAEGAALIPSRLFRPPHGLLRLTQAAALRRDFRIVMHDVVSRDYSARFSPRGVFDNVRRFARPGSIIVFHDSDKAAPRMRTALPLAIEWLLAQGYDFGVIPED